MTVEVVKAETRFISNHAGNGLFATEHLEPGDVVLQVKDPYILIPGNSVISNLCYRCLLGTTNLKCCTGCKTVMYCSEACQRSSWKDIHKLECKALRKCQDEGHPSLPTPVRGLIQALVRHAVGVVPNPGWSHLETHKKSFMNKDSIWQDIQLQATAALKYASLSMSLMDIATSILCAFKVNAFNAEQQDDTPVGLFFEPLFSTANHSCVANTLISFNGRRVSFKVLQPIQKGDEITIYYVDRNQPLKSRQHQLQERYFFTCNCSKCAEDWDVYASFLHNPCCEANRLWLFTSYEELEKESLNASGIDKQDLIQSLDAITRDISGAKAETTPKAAHIRLRIAFEKLKEQQLRITIAATPYPLVLQALIDNYIATDEIEAALVLLLTTVFHIQPFEFPEPWHPIRIATLRNVVTLISQILSDSKYSLHRLRVIPSSQASEVDLFACVCAVLFLVAHYAPRSHASSSKFVKEVQQDLADIERYARDYQSGGCLVMLKAGIWDGKGRLAACKYFGQLEKLANVNLMCQVIESVDCGENGHNGAIRRS